MKHIDLELLELAGFNAALKALHLPFKDEEKSWGSKSITYYPPKKSLMTKASVEISQHDYDLLKNLVLSGDEHSKVLRGCTAWLKITAPRYFFQELMTYRIGTEVLSSSSQMHNDFKGLRGEELLAARAVSPEGALMTQVRSFSYQCLRHIYFQRRNHRLLQWQEFCEFIKNELPFSELITIEKKKES